jgi:ankyrin repeat protein
VWRQLRYILKTFSFYKLVTYVFWLQGSPKVVRLLLDRGLDEMHRDNAGWTPLHYACFEGHISVCEVLLDAGTKLDETDNDGKTSLMLSAQVVILIFEIYPLEKNLV